MDHRASGGASSRSRGIVLSLLWYVLLIALYVVAIGVLAQCTGFNDWIDPPEQGEGDE